MKKKQPRYLDNNPPSDVPLARAHISEALAYCVMDEAARNHCMIAHSLMTRAHAVRRAPDHPQLITDEQKRRVRALKDSDLTYHEITNQVGLPNAGRVSEIMAGRR
jgi:hypothetical protein